MALQKDIPLYFRHFLGAKVREKIFFLHIHKCGGTSLSKAIAISFGLFENITRRHFFSPNYEASVRASKLIEDNVMDYRKKLLLYYMSIERMKYISGHFFYSEKAMEEFGKEWNFLTLLRHPVSRWFSHYFMDRYREHGVSHARICSDLESFVESERALHEARKYVLAFTEGISLSDASSNEAVNQAIENLKKFALVGVLEKMDAFTRDYKNLFGAELFIEKLNKNPLPKLRQKKLISDEILKKVEEICQPSMRVYESVIEKIQ